MPVAAKNKTNNLTGIKPGPKPAINEIGFALPWSQDWDRRQRQYDTAKGPYVDYCIMSSRAGNRDDFPASLDVGDESQNRRKTK
jgi:hypothetical protein